MVEKIFKLSLEKLIGVLYLEPRKSKFYRGRTYLL